MRTRRVWFRNGLAAMMMVCLAGRGVTQMSGNASPTPLQPTVMPDARNPRAATPDDAMMRSAVEKQARLRNDERQKRLVSDTEKLLQLATQLHNDVAKTDKNVLSLDVIRRAEEIERLAHGVKDRMKG